MFHPIQKKTSHTLPNFVRKSCYFPYTKYEWKRGEEILAYHSDTKSDKKKLENVDKIWGSSKVRVVVGNSCLAVGVNFNPSKELIALHQLREFDTVFGFLDQSCMTPRDFLQLIQRIRHPKNPDVHMFFMRGFPAAVKKQSKLQPHEPEPFEMIELWNWSGFGQLKRDLDIESRASFNKDVLKILHLLTDFTSFSLDIDTEKLCKEEITEIRRQIDTTLSVFRWENIETVNEDGFQEVKKKIKSFDADMDDILQYQKYKFTALFTEAVKEEDISCYWGKHQECAYALHQLGVLKQHGTYIDSPSPDYMVSTAARVIYSILEENQIDWKEMEIDIKHCTLPFGHIKRAFHFHHQPTTYRTDLYAKIFNAFFGEKIFFKDERTWCIKKPGIPTSHLKIFREEMPQIWELKPDEDDEGVDAPPQQPTREEGKVPLKKRKELTNKDMMFSNYQRTPPQPRPKIDETITRIKNDIAKMVDRGYNVKTGKYQSINTVITDYWGVVPEKKEKTTRVC
ncbi:hypothetical protein DFS34DRAFT_592452 [Phlyctochytrium arcticum]|nr:hypothetical protein DFS34DRAFT_592452 [Phlyctochytrium arcticum]